MMTGPRKPPAPSAAAGGRADLMAGDPNEINSDLKRKRLHPQGAGGVDVAKDVKKRVKKRTKRRLARVLR
jgi:hypothetical protein